VKKREAERRIAMAQAEISAALLMTIAALTNKPTPRQIRYQLHQAIRCFAYLGEALETGQFGEYGCENCGKAIRPGQYYFRYAEGERMHAKCNGYPEAKCEREPTRREVRAELRESVKNAKEFMRAKHIPEVSVS
jgi:hypothetical protein